MTGSTADAPLILLVDDVSTSLDILTAVLGGSYRVKTATDGPTALALARDTDRPDLILLDVMMPGMSGIEVLQRLRADPRTAEIPVIFVSADASERRQIEGLGLGADDYLLKPVPLPILRAKVCRQLERLGDERQRLRTLLDEALHALRDSEESLRFVLDGSRLGTWDWNLETDIVQHNRYMAELLLGDDSPGERPLGLWSSRIHPEDQDRVWRAIGDNLAGELPLCEVEYRIRARDGQYRWMLHRGRVVARDHEGRALRMSGTINDITARKMLEQELRASLLRIESHAERLTELNRMNDRLLFCAEPAEAYAIIADSAAKFFAPFDGELAICREDRPELDEVIAWGKSPRGALQGAPDRRSLCIPLIDQGRTLGLLRLRNDNEARAELLLELHPFARTVGEAIARLLSNLRLRALLHEQATRDPLTGLFNRRYLNETLPRELNRCARTHEPLTLAMVDIDHFKRFNDDYGHDAGDTVLRAVGALLGGALRGSDLACRYGGEELTLVLPGTALNQAWDRLDTLRQATAALRLAHAERPLPAVTVSMGVAEARPDETAPALLGRADTALYQAKTAGRNRLAAAGDVGTGQ